MGQKIHWFLVILMLYHTFIRQYEPFATQLWKKLCIYSSFSELQEIQFYFKNGKLSNEQKNQHKIRTVKPLTYQILNQECVILRQFIVTKYIVNNVYHWRQFTEQINYLYLHKQYVYIILLNNNISAKFFHSNNPS